MASSNRACKRFFIGVDSEVIEEIASFPELLVTTRILTLHDSPDPPGVCMFVSQYFVIGCVRNMFGFAN